MSTSPATHGAHATAHGGAGPISPVDLLRGVPSFIPDLPGVARGLAIVNGVRGGHRVSIGKTFHKAARRHPDRPFLRFREHDVTYGEAARAVDRTAEVLRRHGVRRGDTVAICLTNRLEAVLCLLATVSLGAAAGLLNHHQRGDVLDHSQRILGSRVVLMGAECGEALDSIPREDWVGEILGVDVGTDLDRSGHRRGERPGSFDGLVFLDDEIAALGPEEGTSPPAELDSIRGRETAYYVFTSGTTGLPKASAMTHHRWIKAMAGFGLSGVRLRGDDVLLCQLPLYHNNAVTVSLGCVLAAGACLAVEEKFSASRYWQQVEDARATAAVYIGELCRYLLAQPERPDDREHGLRMVLGNGLRPELWTTFRSRFGLERICEFYAASECNVAFVNAFDVDLTNGFCPMRYALVEYDGETGEPTRGADGRLRRVARGDTGLLITAINPSQPFDGYTDPEATEKKIVRDAFRDGDAWFVSGDLLLHQGFHHAMFVDRLGDTFRWKGENVSTSEVEGALDSFAGVEQSAVYGVTMPDADGRAGMAAVVLGEGTDLDGQALARHLTAALPSYAVPVFVRVVDELESTSTFKSKKTELREQGYDREQVTDPLYVLAGDRGYVPAYDGAERDVVAGTV